MRLLTRDTVHLEYQGGVAAGIIVRQLDGTAIEDSGQVLEWGYELTPVNLRLFTEDQEVPAFVQNVQVTYWESDARLLAEINPDVQYAWQIGGDRFGDGG